MFHTDGIARHLAVVVVIISALIMGFIIYNLSVTKQDFATQLIDQSSARLQSDLDEFFLPVENLMMTLRQQQENLFLKDFNSVDLNNYFIPVIEQYPQVSSIGLADSRGYEFNIVPDTATGTWLNREVHVDQRGMLEKWDSWRYQNGSLTHLRNWETKLENDPRERPWFIGALAGNDIHWTSPYLYMTGEIGLTASVEWRDSGSAIRRVLAIDVTLNDLSRFSQKLKLTENNQNFILTSPERNIIGSPRGYNSLSNKERSNNLMTSPGEFGYPPLVKLLEYPVNRVVSFESQNKRWWGIVEPYTIHTTQELFLAVLIPESDFSAEIDSTRNAIVGGFIIIFLLSLFVVRSQKKLRKLSRELNELNKNIENQKQLLFTEVHHRVKNNLAIISALIDIENIHSGGEEESPMLAKTQKRILSMSAVHEILYKTDDMNRVRVKDFIPDIIEFHKEDALNLTLELGTVFINVNQALTYALVLNEILNTILRNALHQKANIDIRVGKKREKLVTDIKVVPGAKIFDIEEGVGKELIEVLLTQLAAKLETNRQPKVINYRLSFELQDKKGIISNQKL